MRPYPQHNRLIAARRGPLPEQPHLERHPEHLESPLRALGSPNVEPMQDCLELLASIVVLGAAFGFVAWCLADVRADMRQRRSK